MNRRILIVSAVLGAAALFPGGGSPAMAGEASSIKLDAPAEVVEDSDFTVSIDISDVAAFDAGQFDVSFDESLVRLDDVTAGQVGATRIPVDLWCQMSTGTCRIIVNVPGVPGVSGSGSLAVLHFHAASSAAGGSALDLSNGFLNSNLGTEIAATWTGDSVTVRDGLAPSGETPDAVDSQGSPDTTAERPVFRWWVLGIILGAAVVLVAATVAGVLLRRRQILRTRDN